MRQIILIAHNLRSTHNVGSLLRTADGLDVSRIYLTGYSPYPKQNNDERLPYLAEKITRQISKTALGAEQLENVQYQESIKLLIENLRLEGWQIVALEQTKQSVNLPDFKPNEKIAILVGREVEGLEPEVLKLCSAAVSIPMLGKKESFNVVQAAAMALYHCRFHNL